MEWCFLSDRVHVCQPLGSERLRKEATHGQTLLGPCPRPPEVRCFEDASFEARTAAEETVTYALIAMDVSTRLDPSIAKSPALSNPLSPVAPVREAPPDYQPVPDQHQICSLPEGAEHERAVPALRRSCSSGRRR